jgi:hypothetical protein
MMANITLRQNLTVPLSDAQVDANFTNLNNDIQTRSPFEFSPNSAANLLPNSSAELGNYLWNGTAYPVVGEYAEGTLWAMPSSSVVSSFVQISNNIAILSGVSLYLQCEIFAGGATSGTVYCVLEYLNSSMVSIGYSSQIIAPVGTAWAYYSIPCVTPTNAVYVNVQFGYTNCVVSSAAIRRIKLSASLSPYSQEATFVAMQNGNPDVPYSVGVPTLPSHAIRQDGTSNLIVSNITGILPVLQGGTGATSTTGIGANVLNTSPTLVSPALGTPTSGNLEYCTFPILNQNTTGTASNITGILPVAQGGTGSTTNTGTGAAVLNIQPVLFNPTLESPVLGTPISGNLEYCTFPILNQNTTGSAATANTATYAISAGSASSANSATIATNSTQWGGSNKTVSQSAPSGGQNGDMWFQW